MSKSPPMPPPGEDPETKGPPSEEADPKSARRPRPKAGAGPTARPAVTIRTIKRMALAGEKFSCLTCYDATTARWLERAGVHILLVGDTASEMILGFDRTIDMPLDVLLALTAAVKRGAPNTMVMGDMPFMSYQADESSALRNAARFLTEGRADAVKIEADASYAPLVSKMARAGIPVVAHVGSKPQQAMLSGGYASKGRTAEEAAQVVLDAVALERAGAIMLLVEAVPDEVSAEILARTSVPLIGIGAGVACHGQVLVLHDLIGLTDAPPRFAASVASLGAAIEEAGKEWVERVAASRIGGMRYTMKPGETQRLREILSSGLAPADSDEKRV
ncbi:MAG: 3-methyl-2-oxobutanoate hydroxymethyltransferase [Phycisphaeraceae bacterium]|nr:MAG: 3-methyl-2-oxobutanoate hydroxymethyltransferase [Phycisphaeraceae bacterium]